jgi:hypothetical protein
LVTLPMFDVAPPVAMWGGKEIAIDVWHHLVYVTHLRRDPVQTVRPKPGRWPPRRGQPAPVSATRGW